MQNLHNINNAAAAQYNDAVILGLTLYMGHHLIGSAALPYGRPGAVCLSPRQGFELADHAAPCARLQTVPILGTVPTGTL